MVGILYKASQDVMSFDHFLYTQLFWVYIAMHNYYDDYGGINWPSEGRACIPVGLRKT